MYQVLIDNLHFWLADLLTGEVINPISIGIIFLIGLIAILVTLYVIELRIRLSESRQNSGQTNVNMSSPPMGLNGMITVLISLIVIAVIVHLFFWV